MRQIEDIRYGELCARVKYGNGTQEDYDLLRTRIFNKNFIKKTEFEKTKIILLRNNIRAKANEIMIKDFAFKNNKSIVFNESQDNWQNKGLKGFENKDLCIKSHLHKIDESKTEKMCTKLQLVIGCTYIISRNYCTELGLANNTEVRLERIFTVNDKPICLLVSKLRDGDRDKIPWFQNLNNNLYPIFEETCYFKLNLFPYGKSINISRKQFPLMLCFAVTCNNQQGATLASGLVDLTTPIDGKWSQPTANVALTRFKKLDDLTLVDDFDINILRKKPHKHLLEEENRYRVLANETYRKFYMYDEEYIKKSQLIC